MAGAEIGHGNRRGAAGCHHGRALIANRHPSSPLAEAELGRTPGNGPLRADDIPEEARSLRVYGCEGCLRASPTLPISRIAPAYMTATRSHSLATTPKLLVIQKTVSPKRHRRSLMRRRICAWMVTSRALVGLSPIKNSGRHDSAIANIARCCMPP